MPAQLITVEEAAANCKIDIEIDNGFDLELKMWIAEENVLKYLDGRIDTGWTAETVPLTIKGAILCELGFLWQHRGDEIDPSPHAVLSPQARSLLQMLREPILA